MKKLRSYIVEWWFENITLPQMERERMFLHIILINRMLRKYRTWYQNLWHLVKPMSNWGIGYKYVVENPKIDGKDWYQYFTFTTDEESRFEKFAKRKIKKCYPYNYDKQYSWFSMMYGLMVVDTVKLDLNTLLIAFGKFGYTPDENRLKEGYDGLLALIDDVKNGNNTINTNLKFLDV